MFVGARVGVRVGGMSGVGVTVDVEVGVVVGRQGRVVTAFQQLDRGAQLAILKSRKNYTLLS